MIDVLLVDDHPEMRHLLRQLIETYADLAIVGEAENGEDAVTQAAALHPPLSSLTSTFPR